MEINKRIMQTLNYYSDPVKLEITKASYNKLTNETLKSLKKRNIKIYINNTIPTMRITGNKTDCFAYKDKTCLALTKIDCEGCAFYNNKITLEEIEKSIRNYLHKN